MSTTATRRQIRKNKEAYEHAKTEAGADGMVCGFHDKDGTPHYFIVPRGADEAVVRARAFEGVNGRPMNRAEQLLDAAASGDFVDASQQALAHYLDRSEVDNDTFGDGDAGN